MRRFGSDLVQIVTDVNSAQHVADLESQAGKRPFTRRELQDLFDYSDGRVDFKRSRSKTGWMAAFQTQRSSRPRTLSARAAPRCRCSTCRTSAAILRRQSSATSGR